MKDLNLIPRNFLLEKKNKVKKTYLSILILIIGFMAAMSYILPTVYEINLKTEKKELETQVLQTNNYVEMEKEFSSLLKAVENRELEGKALSDKNFNAMDVVSAIEFAVPEKLFIKQFETSGENLSDIKISLKGVAENEEIIASFIRNLMSDGYFKSVFLSNITNKKDKSGSDFDVSLSGIGNNGLLEYSNWEQAFKIKYPSDWIIKEEAGGSVEFSAVKSYTSARPASLKVFVENTDKGLEAYIQQRKDKLKADLKDFELGYSKQVKTSKYMGYRLSYYADEDKVRYQYMELCVISDNKCYLVTYKSDLNNFSNKARTIDRILNSFSMNK